MIIAHVEESLCQGVTFAKGWSNVFKFTGHGVSCRVCKETGDGIKKEALAGKMGLCMITDSLQTTG